MLKGLEERGWYEEDERNYPSSGSDCFRGRGVHTLWVADLSQGHQSCHGLLEMNRLERQIKKEADRIARGICALHGEFSTCYLQIEEALIRRHNKSIEMAIQTLPYCGGHAERYVVCDGCQYRGSVRTLKLPSRRSPERRKKK